MARDLEEHLRRSDDDAPWLRGFLGIVGRNVEIPDPLPPPLAQGVRAIRAVRRRPRERELPVGRLAAARSIVEAIATITGGFRFRRDCEDTRHMSRTPGCWERLTSGSNLPRTNLQPAEG